MHHSHQQPGPASSSGARSSSSCAASAAALARRAALLSIARKTAPAVALVAACSMASAGPAEAAKKVSKPKRLQAVLDHLDAHPMTLKSVPMIYEREAAVPLPAVADGLTVADVAPTEAGAQSHMAGVILALVAVAFGALDRAHNLVTPLSWGAPTEYGGPPVRGSPAAQEAAFVHALVHRWEGAHDGEFGTGFSNANYWYKATGPHKVFTELQAAALKEAGDDPQLQRYVAGPRLDPTRLVQLCAEAQRPGSDPQIRAFAEKVVNLEWRLLLEHCFASLPR